MAPAEPMGTITPPIASATSYATSGGRLRETTTRGASPVGGVNSGGAPVESTMSRAGNATAPTTAYATDGHGDVHRPVAAPALAKLPGAVERVDDPEAAVARDVLEALLRAHVVIGIEAVQLRDQELVGQPIPRGPDVADAGRCRAAPTRPGRPWRPAWPRRGAPRRGRRTWPLVLDQTPVGGPPRELVPGGQLQLAQHRGDVGLDRLGRDREVPGHLLVGVPAGDEPEDLTLAGESWSSSGSSAAAGRAPCAKASSTNPARRGEKTASPAATRYTAWSSSGPEIVFVM